MQATEAYRRSQEPLADFLADCCTLGAEHSVLATHLRDEYETWCRTVGIKRPLAGRAWGAALRAVGCQDRRTQVGRALPPSPGRRDAADAAVQPGRGTLLDRARPLTVHDGYDGMTPLRATSLACARMRKVTHFPVIPSCPSSLARTREPVRSIG
jgi:phage/plasmid-associated DNA primase